MNVMVTGTGRSYALGFNLVLRYLENGDTVVATIRSDSDVFDELIDKYQEKLIILKMDISSTDSVNKAKDELSSKLDHLDLLINNAVAVSPDCDKDFFDLNPDYIARTVDISAVGPIKVIQAFFPLLRKSQMTSLIINISSEAGSIEKCYRTNLVDYGMAKAALNMATMNIHNIIKDDPSINIFTIHPGWIRTDGKADNPAPLSSYEAAEILRLLFEERRYDKTGHRFITNTGEDYPF